MNIVSKCVHVGSSSRELTWKPAWLDKALRPSISNVISILSSDTICQLNQFNTNSGPPLFELYPNGLYPNGLSLNGLQGQLDYPQLDYL